MTRSTTISGINRHASGIYCERLIGHRPFKLPDLLLGHRTLIHGIDMIDRLAGVRIINKVFNVTSPTIDGLRLLFTSAGGKKKKRQASKKDSSHLAK